MRSGEMTEIYGYKAACELLDHSDPPTAILCSSIIVAFGVRRAVQDLGLVVGRDISIVTHDDDICYLRNGDDVPIFTATRASVRSAGEVLAEGLIEHIESGSSEPFHHLHEAELIVGSSTGPAP
jgi:LacI family transcriptional regulator